MGLFSRFTFNQPGSTLHSSGIAGDDNKIGATSAESFEQRQQIEKNRQHIGSYKEAKVLHTYRHSAQMDLSSSKEEVAVDGELITDDRHKRSRVIPRTSRIDNRQTSRIDKPSRASMNADIRVNAPVAPRAIGGPRFAEPQSRRYNPYK